MRTVPSLSRRRAVTPDARSASSSKRHGPAARKAVAQASASMAEGEAAAARSAPSAGDDLECSESKIYRRLAEEWIEHVPPEPRSLLDEAAVRC